jgi:hypothetical protein
LRFIRAAVPGCVRITGQSKFPISSSARSAAPAQASIATPFPSHSGRTRAATIRQSFPQLAFSKLRPARSNTRI